MGFDDSDRGSDARSRRSRRRVLAGIAGAASVAVAGCNSVPWFGDGSSAFTPDEARSVLESDGPSVEWPVPVEPDSGALEDALERADELVGEVPAPLEREHVPNGVIRETIRENRDEATAMRDEAADATGRERYHALRDAREMHETARAAATAWLAIDAARDELLGELRDERDAVQSIVTDRLADLEYRGDGSDEGRLRAALYCYQRESDLERAAWPLDRWAVHEAEDVLAIGESAGELEFAATTVGIWERFDERYAVDVGDDGDAEELAAAFETALERSLDRAEEADFPEQTGESEEWYADVGLGEFDHRPLEFVAWRAGRSVHDAREGMADALAAGTLGTGLYHALEFEQRLRGFERFRDWLVDRGAETPDDSGEIRSERDAALEAAATARDEIPTNEPSLGAYRLAETLRELAWTDDTVARAADRDADASVTLGQEFGEYAQYRAELEVLPDAVDAFRERLLSD